MFPIRAISYNPLSSSDDNRLVDILEAGALKADGAESDSGEEVDTISMMDQVYLEEDEEEEVEYADPDHLCPKCMPVRGDDILGTQDGSSEDSERSEVPGALLFNTLTPTRRFAHRRYSPNEAQPLLQRGFCDRPQEKLQGGAERDEGEERCQLRGGG